MRILKRLLSSGEERIFVTLSQHAELSVKSLRTIMDVLNRGEVTPLTLERMMFEVSASESRGDGIIRELSASISRGAVPVALIGDFEMLMDRLDDVLDLVNFVAKELSRGFRVGLHKKDEVRKVYTEIKKMIDHAIRATESLASLLAAALRDFKEIQKYDELIDKIEDRVDDIKNSAIDLIYSMGNNIDAITFNHLMELVRTLDSVVDACEDVSHMVLKIVSSFFY